MAYRYFTYTAHYRKPLTWSDESIQGAVNSYKKLKNVIAGIENKSGTNKKYLKEFKEKINDDLDMPGAIAVLWKFVRDEKAEGKIGTIRKMDQVFGLKLLEIEGIKIPSEIAKIADEREVARKEKDFERSDKLRDKLKAKGWIVKDSKEGQEIQRC